MENKKGHLKAGDIYSPKTNTTYKTRDMVSAVRLARLIGSISDWKARNQSSPSPSIKRHVKSINEVL